MKRISRPFTLLELLVVLLILSFALGLTGIKVKQAYDEQSFLSEVAQVTSHLQFAQDIMLVMQEDATVEFRKKDKAIVYQIVTQHPVNSRWASIIGKEHQLKSIRRVEFDGTSMPSDADIAIGFFSRGMAMSQGKLVLSDQEDKGDGTSYQIVLTGYPEFVQSNKYEKEGRKSYVKERGIENLFPQILLEKKNEETGEKKNPI